MPKKKKVAKKKAKVKAKAKSKSKAKVKAKKPKAKAKKVKVPAKKAKKIVPIMQYRPAEVIRPPKGPKLTKTPFSKMELDVFKTVLSDLRKKISGDIRQIEKETLNTSQEDPSVDLSAHSADIADVATDSFDREINIGLATNEQQLLNDVDDALKKIEDGMYGVCEKYGIAISKKRLMAAPYVRHCLQAQEEEEKQLRRL